MQPFANWMFAIVPICEDQAHTTPFFFFSPLRFPSSEHVFEEDEDVTIEG